MAVTADGVAARRSAAVEIDRVSFAHPGQRHGLHDVSLTVHEGEVCCLLGPNGAGKTTLLRCLLRLLAPRRGTIRVRGEDIRGLSPRQLARRVAYVPQSTTMPFPFTALDIALTGRTPHIAMATAPSEADRRIAHGSLERLGVAHLADRFFSRLSGGERQLVMLARALVQEAPVLVLDEPTAALDYGNEVRILECLAGLACEGRSVLMSTHQPAHALSYATRVVLMREGAITAFGEPGSVVTGENLSGLYGVPIQVVSVRLPGSSGPEIPVCIPVPGREHGAS